MLIMTYMLLSITHGHGSTAISAYDYGIRCYKNPSLTRVYNTPTVFLFLEAHMERCYDTDDTGNMIALRSYNDGNTWSMPLTIASSCKETHSPQSFLFKTHTYIMYVCDKYGIAWRKVGNTTVSREHYYKNISNGTPLQIHSHGIVSPSTGTINMPITIGEQFMTLYSDDMIKWKTGSMIPLMSSGAFEYIDNNTMLLQAQTVFKCNAIINSHDNGKTWSDIQTIFPFRRNKPTIVKHNEIIYLISTEGFISGYGLTIYIYRIDEHIWLSYYTIDSGASYDASAVVRYDGSILVCYEKGWRSSIHCTIIVPYTESLAPIDV